MNTTETTTEPTTAEKRKQIAILRDACERLQIALSMVCGLTALDPGVGWADGIEGDRAEKMLNAAINQCHDLLQAMIRSVAGDQAREIEARIGTT